MKKIISILLCMVLMFSFSACGDSEKEAEKETWLQLPYGLKFGISYDELCKALTDNGFEAPKLKEATANDGYLTDIVYENYDTETFFDWSFLNSTTLTNLSKPEDPLEKIDYMILMSSLAFSFNENKEMYEIYCGFTEDSNNTVTEKIAPEIIEYFDKNFGTEGCPDGFENTKSAKWENEELGVSINKLDDLITIVFHDFAHDLDN